MNEKPVLAAMQEKLAERTDTKTPTDIESVPSDQCVPAFSAENTLSPKEKRLARRMSRLHRRDSEHPVHAVHKHPPAKDNPGRVSAGYARDLKNQAEAHHRGTQVQAIAKLRNMGDRPGELPGTTRNALRRKRRARKPR